MKTFPELSKSAMAVLEGHSDFSKEKVDKQTWKTRSTIPLDLEKLNTLDFKEKIYYLATCGWRIEMEQRAGQDYLYAIRYIDRKKRRIYLGKHDQL